MAFIQAMEFSTDKTDEMLEVGGRWSSDAINNGTAKRGVLAEDRANPGNYVWTVFFDSAEAAAKNSDRPETGKFAEEFASLCNDGITFREYDIITEVG